MKKFIIIIATLIANPAYAVGFGIALGGYGEAQNPDWQEQQREARQEQMQREALFEQQQQTRIMQEQLDQEQREPYKAQPLINYYNQ